MVQESDLERLHKESDGALRGTAVFRVTNGGLIGDPGGDEFTFPAHTTGWVAENK